MGKNWDYSELAHTAKVNGGPEKYIELIKEQSMREGKLVGKSEGRTELLIAEGVVGGLCILGFAGYKAFTTIKEKHEKESLKKQESKVKEAEAELIRGMNEVIQEEENTSNQVITEDNVSEDTE